MSLLNLLEDEKPPKGPKIVSVKNKIAAPIQITAEQLLREAKEKQLEYVRPPPKQKITDPEELAEFRLRKRKEFEDAIRKNRSTVGTWVRYANWEETQQELQRCRSVWERALDVFSRNVGVWIKYAEMEMRNKQINHSRNIWDRAVALLPRANQLWYKYVYMEELLENIAGARQVFERWMEWQPEEQAWNTYINFELRYKEIKRARNIFERFVMVHPEHKNWIRFALFEERNHCITSARQVYERAVEFFGIEELNEKLLLAFAKFEERQKEHERVRVIYKYALEHLDASYRSAVYRAYTIHEKKYGDRQGIEYVVMSKRKFQYEEELNKNGYDYDTWFDYIRLLEKESTADVVREAYERAIAHVPLVQEKRHWRRYIHFWIKYAFYEELDCQDEERAEKVYEECLQLIPHKKFTFAKIWIMYAHFNIRRLDLAKARKILGTSIGKCPKDKLFRHYIDLEIGLREFDRCRKFVLGDYDRARHIMELAISQEFTIDTPENVWKFYIDFETSKGEFDKARQLFERLLQITENVKVWISYALFEAAIENENESEKRAREIFKRAHECLRTADRQQRALLLEKWHDFEKSCNKMETIQYVETLMPKKVKNRRKVVDEQGMESGWEEYSEYIFPDEESVDPSLKLLAIAKQWKRQKDNNNSINSSI
ncbi:hypothetical protein GJ496_010214 [Pomphorhynchus laevis]|nr:hypothetical protein GJ496_010214 [Pomphorhynchus laevis]